MVGAEVGQGTGAVSSVAPDGGPQLPRHTSLGYQVSHLARSLGHELRERIAPLGVMPGQFAQLLALYEQDGLTQAELCALVQIEQPTMANTLARMERDGLVERITDPDDGRRSLVLLTPRTRDLQAALNAAARAGNAVATRGLDDRQVTEFLGTLAVMVDNFARNP